MAYFNENYDEKLQSGAHLQRGWRNYHRKMSPAHKRTLLSLLVYEPLESGDYVKPKNLSEGKTPTEAVGKILKLEIVELMRTSKIYNPPKVHKYRVKWTYDNGFTAKVWIQHKLLEPISKKEYKAFFKKHKIKIKPKGK